MLVLGLVSVPEETIVQDYALTAEFIWRRTVDRDAGRPQGHKPGDHDKDKTTRAAYVEQLGQAPPEAMTATIRYVNDNYGSSEGYLGAAGVTPAEIASIRDSLVA